MGLLDAGHVTAGARDVVDGGVDDVVGHEHRVGTEDLTELIFHLGLVLVVPRLWVADGVRVAVGDDGLPGRKERGGYANEVVSSASREKREYIAFVGRKQSECRMKETQ